MNRENLRKLSDYLKGPLKAEFDMDVYTKKEWCTQTCGTIGCAAGHGPYAGVPKFDSESWTTYVSRAFGLGIADWSRQWCFSSNWVGVDNTPLGAAKRIDYLLEHGLPKNHIEQLYRKAPLCY